MLRWLTWHLAKLRLAKVRLPPGQVWVHVAPPAGAADRPANTEPYGQLACCWDEFADWFVPRYAPFLFAAGRHYGMAIGSVLDLACGTGLLSRDLARRGASVVGL